MNACGTAARRARVVLVGSGRMGRIRSSLLYANPRFDLCGVVDVDEAGARALAETYSATPFRTLSDAIGYFGARPKRWNDRPSSSSSSPPVAAPPSAVDGIVVSSPTFTHDAVVREAASDGLSIFTEKPVDDTADKIRDLYAAADAGGVDLCCGFQRRFDDAYVAAARAVRDGMVGRPLTSTIFFADHPCPPVEFLLKGGNIFSDLSAHDVDYIRWALNDDVASVYATGTSSTEELEAAGVHDNATMVMKFRKGTVVTLTLSRSATYGYDQRCEIYGDAGLASVGNEYAHGTALSNAGGVRRSKLKHSFPQRFERAFAAELDAYADCLLLGRAWPVTAEDCVAVQRVSDAARESCETGRVVEIPDGEEEANERTVLSALSV